MAYINAVTILGNLTRDPELKKLPSGTAVVNFSVATNRVWYDKDSQKQESVEFHNIVSFGKTAENIARYMSKGSQIVVQGRLETRSWDDKDSGKKMYRTEIIAEHVQFGHSPNKENRPTERRDEDDGFEGPYGSRGSQVDYPEDDINPEDIPF